VFFISAGNRLSDTNNAFEEPAPLNNRRSNVVLKVPKVRSDDNDDWTTWAIDNEIDSRIISYLNAYETKLFKYEEESKDPSFPSPRTWTKLSHMINGVSDLSTVKIYAGSLIGEGIASEFCAFIKMSEKINVREILKKPELMEKYKGNDKIDQKYSIIATVAEMFGKDNKILDDALALCKYVEPEYSMFMLKMMKVYAKSNFPKMLAATKNWTRIAGDFAKYVL
jgi:hypothetical protein